MGNKTSNIGFALRKITNEQFAIIEDGFFDKGNIRIGTKLRFGSDEEMKLVACFTEFTFESDKKKFLIIEAGCHFQILEEAWKNMYNKEQNSLTVPSGFLSHLALLTVGTTRGILHAKTEGTCFNKYVLPTINVSEMVKENIVFDFKPSKV